MTKTPRASSDTKKTVKKEAPRRCWTNDEEKVLLAALKSLVAKGWKSDNGFRGGYLNRLEEAMKQTFPLTDIKGQPHINSKLTTWKKTYAAIMSILNRSGVGFNVNGDNKIDADPEAWEAIIQTDSSNRNFMDKPLPMLVHWKEVFGKDRATGEGAKDVMESVNELVAEHEDLTGAARKQKQKIFVDLEEDVQPKTESVCQSSMGDSKATSSSKKRKQKDRIDNLCELLDTIHKDTNTRLQDLTEKLGYHADVGNLRKEVWSLLANLEDLSIEDKLLACDKLVMNTAKLEFFTSLPEIARAVYIGQVLSNVV